METLSLVAPYPGTWERGSWQNQPEVRPLILANTLTTKEKH